MYSIYNITKFQCAQANLAPKINKKAAKKWRHFADVITLVTYLNLLNGVMSFWEQNYVIKVNKHSSFYNKITGLLFSFSTVSMLFMLGFLFTCIVLLLNILIAQMTDTYQKVQQDPQRRLEMIRAWIVACVELNSCFLLWRCVRITYLIIKYNVFQRL